MFNYIHSLQTAKCEIILETHMARLVTYLFGKPKNSNIRNLIDDYTSRIAKRGISVIYFPEKKGILEYENKLLSLDGKLILADENGEKMKSLQFANFIKNIQLHAAKIHFAIGPSSGFSKKIKEEANSLISLSRMTFPHELAALLLIEQIYRGMEIIRNSPYHVE